MTNTNETIIYNYISISSIYLLSQEHSGIIYYIQIHIIIIPLFFFLLLLLFYFIDIFFFYCNIFLE